jgi:hypothetical protein
MNIPDHFSERLETVLRLNILKFFDADPDPGSGIFLMYDGKMQVRCFLESINVNDNKSRRSKLPFFKIGEISNIFLKWRYFYNPPV